MKFVDWHELVNDGFGGSDQFARVKADILAGIQAIKWPPGSPQFAIPPGDHLNGVKPIKEAFVEFLEFQGWVAEHDRFDAHLDFGDGATLPFAVEWETGNISSSHRSINRLGVAMHEGRISGGVLVVPTRDLYPHLTDRIGNFEELEPYLNLWRAWDGQPGCQYFAIVTVEQDAFDPNARPIPKGNDGRARV